MQRGAQLAKLQKERIGLPPDHDGVGDVALRVVPDEEPDHAVHVVGMIPPADKGFPGMLAIHCGLQHRRARFVVRQGYLDGLKVAVVVAAEWVFP